MTINIFSYNILGGYYEEVFASLEDLNRKAKNYPTIVALQEVRNTPREIDLIKRIREIFKDFNMTSLLPDQPNYHDLGIVTLSNLSMVSQQKLLLPRLPSLIKSKNLFPLNDRSQYGALSTVFVLGGKKLRVTNIHLGVLGGDSHKVLQLGTVMDALRLESADYEIMCGDFNTTGLVRFGAGKREIFKNHLFQLMDGYSEVKISGWTSDSSTYISPLLPVSQLLKSLLNTFGLRYRQKLDWVFVKGFKSQIGEVLTDMKGSDHYPLHVRVEV